MSERLLEQKSKSLRVVATSSNRCWYYNNITIVNSFHIHGTSKLFARGQLTSQCVTRFLKHTVVGVRVRVFIYFGFAWLWRWCVCMTICYCYWNKRQQNKPLNHSTHFCYFRKKRRNSFVVFGVKKGKIQRILLNKTNKCFYLSNVSFGWVYSQSVTFYISKIYK